MQCFVRLALLLVASSMATPRAQAQDEPVDGSRGTADVLAASPDADSARTIEAPTSAPVTPNADRVEEARLLFLAATRAFESGRFEDALVSFERSYELAEDHAILYNIAVTLERLRRDDEAIEAFQTYLRLRPGTPDRQDIEVRIRVIAEQQARQQMLADATRPESPAEVAVTAPFESATPHDDGGSILGEWWLWTALIAVVVGGAALAVGLVLANDRANPIPGDEGVVLMALETP